MLLSPFKFLKQKLLYMNNFEIANKIHEFAMELADFADIARIRGKKEEYEKNLKQAYILEKEAALRLQSEADDNVWKFLFLKSAGWLAWQLGRYEEALELAELGLADNATGLPLYRLRELKATVKQAIEEQKKISLIQILLPTNSSLVCWLLLI